MKETGIIMSGDHPGKIEDGTKTMTRRTYGLEFVNPDPDAFEFLRMEGDLAVFRQKELSDISLLEKMPPLRSFPKKSEGVCPNHLIYIKCPYGQVGDLLIVKETWATENRYNHLKPSDIPRAATIYYLAGIDYNPFEIGIKRPSIFMPRRVSRIQMPIISLRLERLQEISWRDCKREGAVTEKMPFSVNEEPWKDAFERLWDSINGKIYPWAGNWWVWVIEWLKYSRRNT